MAMVGVTLKSNVDLVCSYFSLHQQSTQVLCFALKRWQHQGAHCEQ